MKAESRKQKAEMGLQAGRLALFAFCFLLSQFQLSAAGTAISGMTRTNASLSLTSLVEVSAAQGTGYVSRAITVSDLLSLATGSGGETNYNGEISVTNSGTFGLVYGKVGGTNFLRSITPGYGLKGTNAAGGTNLDFAVDPLIIAPLVFVTAVSNRVANAETTNAAQQVQIVTVGTLASNAVANLNGFASSLTSTGQTSIGPHQFISTNGSNGLQLSATGSVTMLATFKPANGSNGPLVLSASPTQAPQVTIATNGNVGIGKNPGSTLDVVGSVAFQDTGAANRFQSILLPSGAFGAPTLTSYNGNTIAYNAASFESPNGASSLGTTTTPWATVFSKGFASYATNATVTVGSTGVTNTLTVNLTVCEFAGVNVIHTRQNGNTFSRGTLSAGIDITLKPNESLTGTSCSASTNGLAW